MQKVKQTLSRVGYGAALSLVMAKNAVAAAQAPTNIKPDIESPTNQTDFGEILSRVIDALLLFAGAIAVLFLIIGGFRYVVSTGNAEQVDAARKTILYAVLGLIVIFIAFVLTRLIQDYLGVRGRFDV
ncbi:MAG TPA: pilin [Patescibacteria group bacterium]|jgi:small-conductance mechanosensitive channel